MSAVYNEKKSRILLVKILTRLGSLAFTVFWAFIWMIGMIWTFWTIGKSYRKFYQFPSTITEKKILQGGFFCSNLKSENQATEPIQNFKPEIAFLRNEYEFCFVAFAKQKNPFMIYSSCNISDNVRLSQYCSFLIKTTKKVSHGQVWVLIKLYKNF